jgi:hypothetical protein
MAITIIQPIAPANVLGKIDFPLWPYTDASGATYKIGSALAASGGDLVEATDADPVVGIVGFAMQPGSNIVATHVPNQIYPAGAALSAAEAVTPLLVALALPGAVFEGTLANEGADHAAAATDIWAFAGLAKDSTTGLWYVDIGDTTTNASVLILGFKNQQDLVLGTTLGARVYFTVLHQDTIYDVG